MRQSDELSFSGFGRSALGLLAVMRAKLLSVVTPIHGISGVRNNVMNVAASFLISDTRNVSTIL